MTMFYDNTGQCPNCGLASAFQTEAHMRIWPDFHTYGVGLGPSNESQWMDLKIIRCLHCSETVSYRDQFIRMPGEDSELGERRLIHRTLIYPQMQPRELDQSVPASIRSFFREASQCEQAGALRGAAVLYRAAVEELVKDQGATGTGLGRRIESLRPGPAAGLVADFHEARMLGNDSIHDGLIYSADEVQAVASLIEEATILLYVQPEERRRLRESRQQRRENHASQPSGEGVDA